MRKVADLGIGRGLGPYVQGAADTGAQVTTRSK